MYVYIYTYVCIYIDRYEPPPGHPREVETLWIEWKAVPQNWDSVMRPLLFTWSPNPEKISIPSFFFFK